MVDNFFLFALSFAISFLGAWSVVVYGHKLELIDKPGQRSSHNKSTPKGGGVGILASFILICVFQNLPWLFCTPIVLLSLISLIGDRIEISPKFRMLFQAIVTGIVLIVIEVYQKSVLVQTNVYLKAGWSIVALLILMIFVVGTTNFYNFMDGIDGIAGVTGVVAFGCLGYVSLTKDMFEPSTLAFGIAFACLGFLPWNFPKARVFMGDVGSILLGFVFSILVIILSDSIAEFICYVGFILPFYSDELLTMLERIRDKDRLLLAHRRHLYQILVNERGIAHWKVSFGYGVIQLIICILLIKAKYWGVLSVLSIQLVSIGVFAVVNYKIKRGYI